MDYSEVIALLIARRQELKLSQKHVGELINASKQKMGFWESQRNRASLEDLAEWAEALGLRLVFSITDDERAVRAAELDNMLGQLPRDDQEWILRFAKQLSEADPKAMNLVKGIIAQLERESASTTEETSKSA